VRRKEKKLMGGPGVSDEREGRYGCWLGPGQVLGPGEREGKEKAGARGPLGRGKERWPGRARVVEERGERAMRGGKGGPRGKARLPGLDFSSTFPFLFLFIILLKLESI
jgi:hypothetical protein